MDGMVDEQMHAWAVGQLVNKSLGWMNKYNFTANK